MIIWRTCRSLEFKAYHYINSLIYKEVCNKKLTCITKFAAARYLYVVICSKHRPTKLLWLVYGKPFN